jgi:PAS domain S-box-containing protein
VRDITSQKLMEDARESARLDARFKAYIQNSSEIIKIIDAEGRIQYCSPSYAKIFAASAETTLGKDNALLMDAEDRPGYLLAMEEVRRHPKESQQLQLRFPVADGGMRILQAKLTNLIDDAMVKGILISESDITHVIEAQQSRQESEERFKLLFERSPDAIFVESEDAYILDVNEAACELQGMTREELIGQYVPDLAPEENRQEVTDGFKDLMSGKIDYLQGTTLTKSGKIIEVEVRCSVIVFQNQPALLLLVRDISQRKKEQLLLKESEERFRALVEHATEAIFVIDVDAARMIEVNKNAESLFERSREELMSISPMELSAKYQADGQSSHELQPKFLSRALAGELVIYEWLFENNDGEEIPCEVRLVRFPSATQRLLRASVTDITARKQAELKMQRSREILRIQNERLIELAASNSLNSGDLDLAFEEISKAVSDLLQVTLAGIWLFDAAAERLVCRKEYNSEKGIFLSGREVRTAEYPKYFTLVEKQRVISESDAFNSDILSEFKERSLIPHDIRSTLDAPFRHGGRIAGMIWTMQLHEKRNWEPEELNLVASMADMVTLALQSWERKKAESKLADTLTKMQATFESTRDGILLLNPQGYLLDYNEEYCKLSHIPKAELDSGIPYPGLETLMAHILDPELFKAALERMEEHPEAEERYVYETLDGKVIEMYGRQMLVDGAPRGMLWFLHDITDLKRIEKALLENETKFRNLFSQANDAIILLDDSVFIECNNKAEEMWGLSRKELLGRKSFQLSPEFQPDGLRSVEKAAQNTKAAYEGESLRFYWQHTRGDGQPFDAEVSLNRIQIGDKFYIQALVRDITERLKTEYDLRDSERNNKALLDGIPDLIVRFAEQGLILDYKQSDQQSQIKVVDGAVGKSITEVLPAKLADKVMGHAQQAIAQGRSLQFELELRLNGEDLDFETRIVRSGVAEVLAIIRDVTERKRTEKELIKRNFELDSFVYRASHDLKAPLNSLMGLISLVEGETQESNVLSYIKMMNKSVVKLDTFIRDLADFSRNARLELAQSIIDWRGLINETLENLQFADGADRIVKNLDIQFEGDFYSDPVRIGIIFNNLVSNAIKYQNLKRNDAQVTISIVRDGDFAVIRIADNGIGIPAEHQQKVYNLFFRASVQSYGSGMGMYIVKHAIDRIKGVIKLESQEGVGSTFTVRLSDLGEPTEPENNDQ